MSDKPIHMTGKEYYEALRQARREVLEEAAKLICMFCNHGIEVQRDGVGRYWHGDYIGCRATDILKLAADQGQGQTTQAEPVEERKEV